MFTGLISGIVGGALGGASSIGSTLLSNHHSAKEARAADKRSFAQWWNQTQYGPSLQRKALEMAGYNPMLALGQSTPSMPSTHQGSTSTPDIAGSAASMGRYLRDAVMDKLGAEIENVEADTDLKEAQVEQAKQNTALLGSQTERTDLAFSRDIASTAVDLANVGIAAHNANTLGDLRKANSKAPTSKPPTVKPPVPVDPKKAVPTASHSATSSSSLLRDLGYLGVPAIIGGGLGYLEGKNKEREIKRGDHWDPKDKNNRKERARKKWYLYHDIGF